MSHEEKFAFVLMPFDSSFEDVYRMGIKETASALGLRAERVDEQIYREGMLERIYRQIEAADVIIADMTGKNPNVFYEVGYAHAKDKICILLTSDASDIPFDLKHRRHIVYSGSITTLRKQLMEHLKWALGELENIKKSHIQVRLNPPYGNLTRTKYSATGEVSVKIDLLNESDRNSPDIDSIYFYSSSGWILFQDGKECPSTKSDMKGFDKRHFLTPPVSRLSRGAWAQIKFESNKVLATTFDGEQLKESYKVSGRSVVRIVTSEGNFDYELPIEVTIDEFPF